MYLLDLYKGPTFQRIFIVAHNRKRDLIMNKITTLGSILAITYTTSTIAHGSYYKPGFLAGAHVGISNGSGSFTSNFDPVFIEAASATGKARKTSALFGILGGYRHIFSEGITVGFDISGNVYTNNELNKLVIHSYNNPLTFTNNLSRRYSVIPSVNFGKVFCGRWHLTLGLGIAFSGFRQKITAPFPTASNPTRAASTVRKLGFVPSIAVEYAATQNVSVTGNISYEIYKKISKTFNGQSIGFPIAGSSYTSSISPRYLTLKVGAVYRF